MTELEDLPGVGPAIAKKLEEAGYSDLMAIAVASPSELAEVADIGAGTASKIIQAAREKADVGGFETGDVLLERLKERQHLTTGSKALDELLIEPFDLIEKIKEKIKKEKPYTIVFFGINGSGKTTTIAKLSHLLKKNKITSVLAASDTFRAASIEQLEKHGEKLGVKVIKHKYGSDPAAVAFDAIAHAKAQGIDCVLVDTAGRIHVKADLMREMEKICRVAKPDLKVFVAESIVGNDAVEQARAFDKAIGIDAIILTKADVDEKGGALISVSYVTKKPIIFLGTGQEYKDLKRFEKENLIKSIFS